MTLMHPAATAAARETAAATCSANTAWPAEVEFIMSALEAARSRCPERRGNSRRVYRALGRLRLFSDGRNSRGWDLFTRDATPRAMGFITRHRLPLGYGGIFTIIGPDGQELAIECTVRRCRETVHGWFEGSLSFNREQFAFCEEADESPHTAGCIFQETTE